MYELLNTLTVNLIIAIFKTLLVIFFNLTELPGGFKYSSVNNSDIKLNTKLLIIDFTMNSQ